MIRLRARDGHELDAYFARPTAGMRGGVVIAQEMYGINAYLRSVCDFYAARRFTRLARRLSANLCVHGRLLRIDDA
jgi:carboxymethylenebutenolidase